jgi:hypothetical protein
LQAAVDVPHLIADRMVAEMVVPVVEDLLLLQTVLAVPELPDLVLPVEPHSVQERTHSEAVAVAVVQVQ